MIYKSMEYILSDKSHYVAFLRRCLCVAVAPLLLPSANEVAERLCFTCLSFCPQGRGMSAPEHAGIHPRADTPPGRHPTSRRLLLRTVRILLECILVNHSFIYNLTSSKKFLGRILLINYLSQVVRTCSKRPLHHHNYDKCQASSIHWSRTSLNQNKAFL